MSYTTEEIQAIADAVADQIAKGLSEESQTASAIMDEVKADAERLGSGLDTFRASEVGISEAAIEKLTGVIRTARETGDTITSIANAVRPYIGVLVAALKAGAV